MTTEHTRAEVQQAKEGLREHLIEQAIPFTGIGKSALEGADVSIRVYFPDVPTEEIRQKIPETYNDVPVSIEINGGVTPLDNSQE